ncbi:outer membrane receptor protein involved in Fe transport [Sphingomonas jejuensis]|uniref:Outer membrane receptor protein involved in Fe transport n=1 Tax=Sphingomonas jejuensis TaxID=904715 RepID=A0ABX0XK14_9SPHN|nr:TonB-dependent receptor [Sphingomonas jejuensis]NJC33689.1 outer membrane receptor protein involved in Fe transport [Sphingomonas jejuensis]
MTKFTALRLLASATALAAGTVALPQAAYAQTTTASLRGQVRDGAGQPVSGATVTAVATATNITYRQVTDAQGRYTLNAIRPGAYRVTIEGADSAQRFVTDVVLGVGQAGTLDAALTAAPDSSGSETVPGQVEGSLDTGETITVTATRLPETRTSEVATNVTQDQIRILPQSDRNFLSFAALAPGVRYNDSETSKTITSGASVAAQVNVFIDGVSLKNQVQESGIAGQQNSRGNPFGQLAVQEFRVLTQNYKAEYDQAAAAIVTAVTKSGTNEFHGEFFGQYTDRSLAATDFFVARRGEPEPVFERKQYGASLGGPIIEDRLFFFAAYEANDQDRAFNVSFNPNATAEQRAIVGDIEGSFVSPFRSDFYFGKLTFTPDDRQVWDLSYSRREETDIQGFGGQTAFEFAENKLNTVDTYALKWTYSGDDFVNEFTGSYLSSTFNPTALNPDLPTLDYQGLALVGGRDATRRYTQDSYILRNDLTYSGLDGHVFKGGLRIGFQDYDADDQRVPQGKYIFRISNNQTPNNPNDDTDFSFPAEAQLGLGNSLISASNFQLGVYIQDDWDITDRLQLNLGLRWDYEDNMFNNKYVTPAAAAAALRTLPVTDYFDPEAYITDGTDRPPATNLWQPRIGFSYDLFDNQSTVIFGGYGRYYDRNVFINTLDERYRQQYRLGTFFFSRDGQPRDGNPTVVWDPRYLTREGLLELQATARTGLPELFAVPNEPKVPVTDQFSVGVRQQVGVFQASITGTYIRGRNGYTHLFATRLPNGECCDTSTVRPFGFANALIGYAGLDTRYYGLFFTLDKPYSESSGWGLNIAYTLSKGEQNGNDLFSLDKITPDDYGFRPRPGDQRHRVVLSGIVDLPFGFRASTLTTVASKSAIQVTSPGGVNEREITSVYPGDNNCLGIFAFCEVNLTLENEQEVFGGHNISFAVDLLNAFNNRNFGTNFNASSGPNGEQFFEPNNLATLPRRVQFRVGYRF